MAPGRVMKKDERVPAPAADPGRLPSPLWRAPREWEELDLRDVVPLDLDGVRAELERVKFEQSATPMELVVTADQLNELAGQVRDSTIFAQAIAKVTQIFGVPVAVRPDRLGRTPRERQIAWMRGARQRQIAKLTAVVDAQASSFARLGAVVSDAGISLDRLQAP